MTFQFANVSELNFGVTMHELCAAGDEKVFYERFKGTLK